MQCKNKQPVGREAAAHCHTTHRRQSTTTPIIRATPRCKCACRVDTLCCPPFIALKITDLSREIVYRKHARKQKLCNSNWRWLPLAFGDFALPSSPKKNNSQYLRRVHFYQAHCRRWAIFIKRSQKLKQLKRKSSIELKMKPSIKKLLAFSLVFICLLFVHQHSQAAPATQEDNSCQLRAKEAKDCSLCCALGGYNKFDSQQFQSGKGCKCYKDEKEIGTNLRHKQRRP